MVDLDEVLSRVACGLSTAKDAEELRKYIGNLQARLVEADNIWRRICAKMSETIEKTTGQKVYLMTVEKTRNR